jgi:hypothetical protein
MYDRSQKKARLQKEKQLLALIEQFGCRIEEESTEENKCTRRLDSLARLLEGKSMCAAVAFASGD